VPPEDRRLGIVVAGGRICEFINKNCPRAEPGGQARAQFTSRKFLKKLLQL
jgi:hypothetical protein